MTTNGKHFKVKISKKSWLNFYVSLVTLSYTNIICEEKEKYNFFSIEIMVVVFMLCLIIGMFMSWEL